MLLETVAAIVEFSPYRPFGVFVFCVGNGKLVVLDNSDAVLQLLFFFLQLCPKDENNMEFHHGMMGHHFLDLPLAPPPFSPYAAALNDLGPHKQDCVCTTCRLSKRKTEKQTRIDAIRECLKKLEEYERSCEIRRIGYYDVFKIQRDKTDFDANVKRQEIDGIWDRILEMIKRYELPDGFEGRKEWIELGTIFRRLTEPLDIANYHRHLMNENTGPYMVKGRPKRYKFRQKWREHHERMEAVGSSETTFWAEVEELKVKEFGEVKEKVLKLEKDVFKWVREWIRKDVFLEGSFQD